MNLMALVAAVVGIMVFIVIYLLSNKIENRTLKSVIQLIGLAVSFIGMNLLLTLLSADLQVSSTAGTYFFIILVIIVVVHLFLKKKNKNN